MTQPEVKPDQVWVEIDPRFKRYVRVIDVASDTVTIRKCNADGDFDQAPVRQAKRARFNGRSKGYAIHFNPNR